MSDETHRTVGQVAELLGLHDWQVRRAVDAIAPDVPRVGQYRMIPRSLVGKVAAECERRGWFAQAEAAQ